MYNRLVEQVKSYGSAVLGLSGGVDSTLVACAMKDSGIPFLAVTVRSPLHPRREGAQSACFCRNQGIAHELLALDTLQAPAIAGNAKDRCYHCKKRIFTRLQEIAQNRGYAAVVDGSHADDRFAYRPGLRALAELGVKSPLAELHCTKAHVRQMAVELGLAIADKPSAPCLATRFPYGDKLTEENLRRVEQAEELLNQLGLTGFRARVHGNLLRIEAGDVAAAFALFTPETVNALKALGYPFVTLDLSGYQPGCFDEEKP